MTYKEPERYYVVPNVQYKHDLKFVGLICFIIGISFAPLVPVLGKAMGWW